jgi:pilus assembly protein CpaC
MRKNKSFVQTLWVYALLLSFFQLSAFAAEEQPKEQKAAVVKEVTVKQIPAQVTPTKEIPAPLKMPVVQKVLPPQTGPVASNIQKPIAASSAAAQPAGFTIEEGKPGGPSWMEPVPAEKNSISVVTGRSHFIRFTKDISRISISDPEVLDFLLLSPNELLLNAKTEGSVNLIIWDIKNEVSIFDINVTKDPGLLLELLKQVDPTGNFEIYPSKNVFVVKGEVSSVEKTKQVEQAANAFAEGSVSLVRVKDVKQILLQIRFIQIDLSRDYEFGMDIEYDRDGDRSNSLLRFLPGLTDAVTDADGDNVNFLTPAHEFGSLARNDTDIFQFERFNNAGLTQVYLKALEDKGVIKTIARPNLIAKDGEEASFLVGGETAIVTQSGTGSVTVTYKEFGTKLKFKPEMLEDGKVRLTIEPEVSALNAANGATVGTTTVPGFDSTKVKSVVELKERETFMVSGLIQQKLQLTESGVPYLRRMPWIGKLFQSTDQELQNIELLVLVTPVFLKPEKEPIPETETETDLFEVASRFQENPAKDEQAEAIEKYIRNNERYLTEKITAQPNPLDQAVVAKTVVQPGVSPAVKPGGFQDLNDMKAELQKL